MQAAHLFIHIFLDVLNDALQLGKVFAHLLVLLELVGDVLALLSHKEKRSGIHVTFDRPGEGSLKQTDLVDKLLVCSLDLSFVHFAEDLTHDSQEQVSEDYNIEQDAGEEEEPLGVGVVCGLSRIEATDTCDERILPVEDILSHIDVFPVPETADLFCLVERWLENLSFVFQRCGLDVHDLGD